MRAADTNLLVRYVTNDDPKQADAVDRFFEQCRIANEPVFIPVLVLCELVWTLDRLYDQTKPEIAAIFDRILNDGLFQFEWETAVRNALESYRTGKANFADYVIGEIGKQSGCRDTVTFDRALKDAPGFTILRSSR